MVATFWSVVSDSVTVEGSLTMRNSSCTASCWDRRVERVVGVGVIASCLLWDAMQQVVVGAPAKDVARCDRNSRMQTHLPRDLKRHKLVICSFCRLVR